MGLLERLWRAIRANLNSLMGRTEDPEKLLEQAVADMQQDLIQMRQGVAQAIASQKRTERQAEQNRENAEQWQRRAQLALEKGDENLAREALVRRQSYVETARTLEEQIAQQSQIVAKLKQDLRTLEGKVSEAKTKKDMYLARARSAEATQRVNEFLGDLNPKSALRAFESMEEKVLELEASAQASQELGTDDLERQFASIEGSQDIDAQLAAMKSAREEKQLPPETSQEK